MDEDVSHGAPGTIPCVTEQIADFLLSPPGRALLAEADALLAARTETLMALTRLRKTAAPEQASAAWEMADLRRRGQAKFGPQAAGMYFVREALEQASGGGTATYHASRFVQAGITTVADLGGGIGGDALAFARAGLRVTLYEQDPVRARFATENARAWGLDTQISVVTADITESILTAEAAWWDPARRKNSRRVSDPEEYSPPLSWLDTLPTQGVGAVGVKLSPAIDHALSERYGAELEFLSEGGECREALLWLGTLQSGHRLRATVLTAAGPQTLAGLPDKQGPLAPATIDRGGTGEEAPNPNSGGQEKNGSRSLSSPLPAPQNWGGGAAPAGRYLYEPDPAVIRAHLIGTLAAQLDALPVDPQIAYLLGDRLTSTPFATTYEVLDRFPYGKKRLQDALTACDVGRVIIKKRGFPQEPDDIRRSLKLRGTQEMIVILARLGTGHDVFLCRLASLSP